LAGTAPVSPDAPSEVTQRRGLIPSTAFFTDRISAAQRENYNASPNRSSSPTLGNDGFGRNTARKFAFGGLAAGAAGAAGVAAMEGYGHNQRARRTTSPIPEHPAQNHPRESDGVSVTSLYREDWPGPSAAGVDPLFNEEFPLRGGTAAHYQAGGNQDTIEAAPRPESNVSIWPGPNATFQNSSSMRNVPYPGEQFASRSEDELPETIRPSPARTPQIHSAEIDSFPFPERQASPHTGFNRNIFTGRRPTQGPFSSHGMQ
jgi:hypothetical protein